MGAFEMFAFIISFTCCSEDALKAHLAIPLSLEV